MTTSNSESGTMLDDTSPLDTASNGPGGSQDKRKSKKTTKAPSKTKNVPSPAQRAREAASANAVKWSHRYTALAVTLSSALNAYSSATSASTPHVLGMVASGVIGALVPVLVWVLGTVTAWTYRAGHKRLSYISGGVACCVLALSVVHVAGALAALTGTGWMLASLLAVGIDCGLVSSEATAILVSTIAD